MSGGEAGAAGTVPSPVRPAASAPLPPAVAVVVTRGGRLPAGTDDAVGAAGGTVVLVGSGTADAALAVRAARRVLRAETGEGLRPAELGARLAPVLGDADLVVLPASADGRDLAPRIAAALGRPLLAGAERVSVVVPGGRGHGPRIAAALARLDDRVLVEVTVDGPAVATLVAHRAAALPESPAAIVEPLDLAPADGPDAPDRTDGLRGADGRGGEDYEGSKGRAGPDPEVEAVLEPDLASLDLADARVVVAGGAGLAVGLDDPEARAAFTLLGEVANALGGVVGATRVATDAGWTGYERQIGTTGVAVDPELYVALGISGAAQHLGGLGSPRHVVSVNVDGSCPMTAMADLGLVSDARGTLLALAGRLGLEAPAGLVAAGPAPTGPGAAPGQGTGRA